MSASSRARVLLQHCSRTGESTTAPPFHRSFLRSPLVDTVGRLADQKRRLFRSQPPVGGRLILARYSSSGASGSERSGSSIASEAGKSSHGEHTAASSLSAQEDLFLMTPPKFAFAFDIDGVLMYSSKPLPGAAETLRYLQRHRIPFILLTNGGGKPEVERVAELSSKLGVELDTSNFVQSHTPFSLLARPADEPPRFAALSPRPSTGNAYAAEKASTQVLTASGVLPYLTQHFHTKTLNDSTVLVLGSDASKARHIAHGYGFKSVVTPGDILKACPQIFPFNPLHEFYDKQEILPLPKPIYNPQNPQVSLEDCLKIDAILVFNDPRDWAVDIQLIMDLMLSHRGYLGTTSRNNGNSKLAPEDRWQKDGQPVLIFSNGDLLWSTGYHLSRFGQGAFRAAVEAAFRAVVSRALQLSNERTRIPELKSFQFGKPGMATYTYAEQVLNKYHKSLWRQKVPPRSDAGLSVQLKHWYKPQPFRINTVYMVGDNPESDILGANTRAEQNSKDARVRKGHRPSWKSCLVRTGVWNEEDAPLKSLRGLWSPIIVRDNVKDTVNWALEEQGWPWEVEEEVGKDEEV